MLDAGLAWSQDRDLGVDFSVPRLTTEQAETVQTVALTHSHEDHVGALPYILRQLPRGPRIVAGPVTAAIIRARLGEARIDVPVETVGPYEWAMTERFRFQMVPVPHSASESMALYIETPKKRLFYSGDLRGSDESGYGRLPAQSLRQYKSIDVLLLEAVRADVDEPDPTLADLKEGLLLALRRLAGRRVIVSAFASNLTRLQIVIELAQAVGRHCYVLGRSMRNAVEMAQEFERMPSHAWTIGPPPRDAADSKVLIMVAGAQGEPDAGLSRLIRGHYPVQARRGDGLIMSSTPIPGNEEPFWSLVEMAMRKGVEVITYRDYLVHISGHSTGQELQRVMKLIRPGWVIPFHGDYYRHAVMRELGARCGIPSERIVQAANGDRVLLDDKPRVIKGNGSVDYYQLAKGKQRSASRLSETVLDERARIRDAGLVVIRPGRNRLVTDCMDCRADVTAWVERHGRDIGSPDDLSLALKRRFRPPPAVVLLA